MTDAQAEGHTPPQRFGGIGYLIYNVWTVRGHACRMPVSSRGKWIFFCGDARSKTPNIHASSCCRSDFSGSLYRRSVSEKPVLVTVV